jgi:hypothetical protein
VSEDNSKQRCLVAWCECCDRVVFATIDTPGRRKENAREVAKCISAGGLRIGTLTVAEVRKTPFGCVEKR